MRNERERGKGAGESGGGVTEIREQRRVVVKGSKNSTKLRREMVGKCKCENTRKLARASIQTCTSNMR